MFKVSKPLAGLIDSAELYNLLADRLKFISPVCAGIAKDQWRADCMAVAELVEDSMRARFLYFCGVIDGDELNRQEIDREDRKVTR